MPRTIVFDVNETLLDLASLDPLFETWFGNPDTRQEWFAQVLKSAFVAVATGHYSDFSATGGAALTVIGQRHGVAITQAHREALRDGMARLPAHADVEPALRALRSAGLTLATLTNNPPNVVQAQLRHADIDQHFDHILSVDTAGSLKPAPVVYRTAARELGVETADIRMVAAHDWDVTGAQRAGCRAAFVARPGQDFDPLGVRPDIVGPDLMRVAEAIIAAECH
ncbi:MAG: haloacid dehalogenase type II [Gammaproteobacteria bacterium]